MSDKLNDGQYHSVLEMVQSISDDPEFVEDFERNHKLKSAVVDIMEGLSPSQRLYVLVHFCPYCGEKRGPDNQYPDLTRCSRCANDKTV